MTEIKIYIVQDYEKYMISPSEVCFVANEKDLKDIRYEIEAINKALKMKESSVREKISEISSLIVKHEYEKAKEMFFSEISKNENDFNVMFFGYLYRLNRFDEVIMYSRKINVKELKLFNDKFLIDDYYKKLSNSLINEFLKNSDNQLLEEVILITENELKNNENLLDEYIFARILKATDLIDEKKYNEAKDVIELVINLDFNSYSNSYKHLIQELVTFLWEGNEKRFTKNFKKYVKALNINERIKLYKDLSFFSHYNNFICLKDIIEEDILNSDLKEIILNWITNILTKSGGLNIKDLEFLNDFISKNKKQIPELTIPEIYINTYREVVLNENETALYELPKEQREFFEKNILKREK